MGATLSGNFSISCRSEEDEGSGHLLFGNYVTLMARPDPLL